MAIKSPKLIYNNEDSLRATAVTVTSSYSGKLQASNYGANVRTINAFLRTKPINITGNDNDNLIIGGDGNDTLDGGKGNNVLDGGAGNDVFVHSGNGNATITDYIFGEDVIKISGGSISGYSVSGNDIILKVGTSTLKILDGNLDAITIKDAKNKISVYQDGLIYNNANIEKATAVTISSNYDDLFVADDAMISINASNITNAIEIVGNQKNNKIFGGAGNDTLNGGEGNDTLTGGAGADVFFYESGKDVIADYTENEDIIELSAGVEVVSYSASGKDLVLKTDNNGSIKVKNGRNQAVKISTYDSTVIYKDGLLYSGDNISSADSVMITSVFGKEFDGSKINAANIDASTKKTAVQITGNSKNNFIVGSKKNDTIIAGAGENTVVAGKGNDILIGGSGRNIYLYESGDGKDSIQNYSAGRDIISLAGDYEVSYSTAKNGNAVFKIGSGSITVKDGANTAVTIIGANGEASVANHGNFSSMKDISGAATVYVTLPPETVTVYETVTVGGDNVTVTVPGRNETVTVYETVTVGGNTVTVTVPGENVTIYGGGKNVVGTAAAETLRGTAGNDTLTGGAGADVFVYEGGFDIIQDYGTGNDKISVGSNSVSNYGVIGNDGIFFVGDGALKIVGAKDKKISVISGGKETAYDLTATSTDTTDTTITSAETVTLESGFTGTFSLSSYNATAESAAQHIDASAVTSSIDIYGDDRANIIRAGKSGGRIYSGSGNDFIYCGKGNDSVCYYSDDTGNKTVYDFKTGDVVLFDTYGIAQFKNFSLSGNDVIINLTSGYKITLKDAKDQSIRLDDWGVLDITNTFGKVSISNGIATLESGFFGTFKAEWYALNPKDIDASAVRNSIEIHGDDRANIIRAGRNGGNIYAGEGNDTIYCGNGNDVIYYYEYDGQDTIYNYKTGDRIILDTNGKVQFESFALSGNDVIINLTQGGKITLKDAKEQTVYVQDRSYSTYNGTINELLKSTTSSRTAENIWFLEDDNNFVGGDIDSIVEAGESITDLNLNPVEAENIFGKEENPLVINSEQK